MIRSKQNFIKSLPNLLRETDNVKRNSLCSKTTILTTNQLQHDDHQVFIVSTARTPIGSLRGKLTSFTAPQLGVIAIRSAIEKCGIPNELIEEVQMGVVVQSMIGQNPARQAALGAGLPNTVVTTTLNRVCSSSVKAYMSLSQAIQCGHIDIAVAGGMESLSNVPYYLPRGELPYGGIKLIDGLVHDLTDKKYNILMGYTAERTAQRLGITREQQDQYALLSYQNSAKAVEKITRMEITPVTIPATKHTPEQIMIEDEEFRKVTKLDKLSKLPPAFPCKNNANLGTVTAGNTGKLTDGASAAILASGRAVREHRLKPLARIVSFSEAAIDPLDSPIATVYAIRKVLQKAAMRPEQIDLWEINESFAVVVLANIQLLQLNPDKVNIHGGAVSIGHPVGMSGSRIINHLALHLEKGQFGMAAICNAGGGASAVIIEKL